PKELQDMLDSIVLEVEDEDGDPDWLIAMMPAIIARLGKNLIKSNWALWSKAWQSAIGTAWEMGTVGDTVGTVAPALIGGNEGLQYFLNHGMELVKTLSQTDIQLLKGQMVDNWGKNLKTGDDLGKKLGTLLKDMASNNINEAIAQNFAADIASYLSSQDSVDEIKKNIKNSYHFFDDMGLSEYIKK
ncbi:MAG TPA: hypothetical protein PK443_06150, partial [bacterium]|nr:hypothetical protein [bacterium]